MEKTKEEALAYEIAGKLDDLKSIDWHIKLCHKYSEHFLRQRLAEVFASKRKDNPARLYNYLVNLYGQRTGD